MRKARSSSVFAGVPAEAVADKEATACAAPAAIIAHDQRLRVSGAAGIPRATDFDEHVEAGGPELAGYSPRGRAMCVATWAR